MKHWLNVLVEILVHPAWFRGISRKLIIPAQKISNNKWTNWIHTDHRPFEWSPNILLGILLLPRRTVRRNCCVDTSVTHPRGRQHRERERENLRGNWSRLSCRTNEMIDTPMYLHNSSIKSCSANKRNYIYIVNLGHIIRNITSTSGFTPYITRQ